MGRRATIVNTTESTALYRGDPILDADEGVLIIQNEDGSSRTFNWDFVIDFYHLSEEETAEAISDLGKDT